MSDRHEALMNEIVSHYGHQDRYGPLNPPEQTLELLSLILDKLDEIKDGIVDVENVLERPCKAAQP